jgi:hypothetical protein
MANSPAQVECYSINIKKIPQKTPEITMNSIVKKKSGSVDAGPSDLDHHAAPRQQLDHGLLLGRDVHLPDDILRQVDAQPLPSERGYRALVAPGTRSSSTRSMIQLFPAGLEDAREDVFNRGIRLVLALIFISPL